MTTEYDCPCCKENKASKPTWGPGPWQDEPERVEFEHADLPCILHRGGGGAWCGYVGLAPGHPAHKADCSDSVVGSIEVHGGLTYAEACAGHVCHVPKPGEPDDLWWLGFDCSHAWDLRPKDHARLGELGVVGHDEVYRDIDYVRRETERLAEQLAAMAPS